MLILETIAERRISEAQARGEFDNLPGAGAPLALDDDALVPEELRAAYRVLKNAGFLPPQLEWHSEIRDIERLLQSIEDGSERAQLQSRMNFLLACRSAGRRHEDLRVQEHYLEKLVERLTSRRGT